jgi:hypothetical protein
MSDNKKIIVVTFTFDLNKVNHALGNTPNVGAEDALMELIELSIFEYDQDLTDISFKISE